MEKTYLEKNIDKVFKMKPSINVRAGSAAPGGGGAVC